jgi:hypothetical protein
MMCLSWPSSSVKDSCTCDLVLIITISDTSENHTKRLGSHNHINLSRLIGYLGMLEQLWK